MSLRDRSPKLAAQAQIRLLAFASLFALVAYSVVATSASAVAQEPAPAAGSQTTAQILGTIQGTVADRTGGIISGAKVTIAFGHGNATESLQTLSGEDGQFSFASVLPGDFKLSVSAQGFGTYTISGTLKPGESLTVPQIVLALATEDIQVHVTPENADIAEDQIKIQEKQRVLGVIPNYYVTYVADAAPLNTKQKFELAWKSSIDPVTFAMVGVVAGFQQSQNTYSGYGQGAGGYGRRYGASYGNFATSTFLGSAVFPSVFKQDPRYFYKGSGSKRSRAGRALASSVMCKGDNGNWQFNYSAVLGGLAAGGISNLYYPSKDRNGVALTFENALIGIGETAAANLFQEFVVRKLTPRAAGPSSANP